MRLKYRAKKLISNERNLTAFSYQSNTDYSVMIFIS